MKLEIILGIFAFILLGAIPLANGQSADIANHVIINEVDINPPGDDSKSITEWVEIFNPTNEEVYIGDWEIASTTVLKKTLIIPVGTTIKPGQFLTYSYQSSWFTDVAEQIELRDETGTVIDETPSISDIHNDFSSWQRVYDGFDTNTSDDWKFITSTAGSSNGKQIVNVEEESLTITVTTDKEHYNFFDIAVISGSVSKQVFTKVPSYFEQKSVEMIISGPSYYKVVTLYPDANLNFATTLKLQAVLGHNEGPYDVSITYDTATANTQFTLGTETVEAETISEGVLVIATDKPSYLPGETVIIFGETSEILQFEGLKFEVINGDRIRIAQGTLYPSVDKVTDAVRGGDLARETFQDSQFTTRVYVDNINPSYGTYQVTAQYGENQYTETTFEVLEDVKEDITISLRTDKPVYKPGDQVVISGRLNNLYVPTLNLNIDQTQTASLVGDSSRIVKIKDGVRLEGDSSFTYEFRIPNNEHSLGEFRITVSENVGRAVMFINVVENPELFEVSEVERLSISTDKTIYEIGEKMKIIGKVGQLQESSSFYNPQVDVLIVDETGARTTIDIWKHSISGNQPSTADLFYTGVPDAGGNFVIEQTLSRNLFPAKDYRAVARYADGKFFDSTNFKVVDPFDIGKRFELKLNKDVFGFGETVFLDGLVPGIAQHDGVKIAVIQPDGNVRNSGVLIDNSRFSWSWDTPITEKRIDVINERSVTSFLTNYGIYQIVVAGKSGSESIFFKVSPNPEDDTLDLVPLDVTTDKAVYGAGETMKVIGSAIKREQGMEGLVVEPRAHITINDGTFPFRQMLSSSVYLDIGGNLKAHFHFQ